jgi:hypothetical protein
MLAGRKARACRITTTGDHSAGAGPYPGRLGGQVHRRAARDAPGRPPASRPAATYFLEHYLAIADVYVALLLATRAAEGRKAGIDRHLVVAPAVGMVVMTRVALITCRS